MKEKAYKIAKYTVLDLFVVIQLMPLVWLVLFSLKDNDQIFNRPAFSLPSPVIFENYTKVFQNLQIHVYLLNSAIVTVATIVFTLLFSAMAAYACTRMHFKWGGRLVMIFLAGIMVPVHAALLPLFILFKYLGILNTHLSLIIPYIAFAMPTALFILTGFLKTMPAELEEAACIDGCNIYQIFFKVVFPLLRVPLATVAIFTFINTWNELMFALTFTTEGAMKTLPVAVMSFQGIYMTDWGPIGAAMLVATAPTLIIYMLLSEQMQKGMLAGAIKG